MGELGSRSSGRELHDDSSLGHRPWVPGSCRAQIPAPQKLWESNPCCKPLSDAVIDYRTTGNSHSYPSKNHPNNDGQSTYPSSRFWISILDWSILCYTELIFWCTDVIKNWTGFNRVWCSFLKTRRKKKRLGHTEQHQGWVYMSGWPSKEAARRGHGSPRRVASDETKPSSTLILDSSLRKGEKIILRG